MGKNEKFAITSFCTAVIPFVIMWVSYFVTDSNSMFESFLGLGYFLIPISLVVLVSIVTGLMGFQSKLKRSAILALILNGLLVGSIMMYLIN